MPPVCKGLGHTVGPCCPQPPSLAPSRPSLLPDQKLAKVLGFLHQAGSISLPGLWLGVSLSANRANHLPSSVWSEDCLPSLILGSGSVAGPDQSSGLQLLGKDGGGQKRLTCGVSGLPLGPSG